MPDSPHERRRTILRALSPTTVHSVQALSRLTGGLGHHHPPGPGQLAHEAW